MTSRPPGAEREERFGQHLRVGDVVVEHVDALAAGEFQHFGREVVGVVVDGVVRAELEFELRVLVGSRNGDHFRPDHVLGDLDADRAEIAAGAHDEHCLAGFELGHVEQQVPGGRHVAHDNRGVVEIETVGQRDQRTGRHGDHLGKAARPFDPHHADRPGVAGTVFRADVERHHARRSDTHAFVPSVYAGSDRVDHA